MTRKRIRRIATWRQIKKNGFYESGIIYNNSRMPCDEIYFRWIIDGKTIWNYELTVAESLIMMRGLNSALYYKLAKQETKKFGRLLNKNNLIKAEKRLRFVN